MADMVLSPSPSPPPRPDAVMDTRPIPEAARSSSSISMSRPPTGASSRSGDVADTADGPPPSPSSTSQSEVELDAGDGFAADLGPSDNFTLADRRATLKSGVSGGGSSSLNKFASLQSPTTTTLDWQDVAAQNLSSPANLPHEILLHIFKFLLTRTTGHAYLRNCLLVCRSWCLCGVELLWHRPAFLQSSALFQLIGVIRRPDPTFPYVTYIRRLNFTGIASELSNQLFTYMGDCSRLERLAIGDCTQLTDDSVAPVLRNLKNLVSVDLTNVKSITDASILALANNCKRLQGINLTNCKQVTSVGIAALGNNCPLLRRVKLCGCELVGDDGILPLVMNCPMLLEIDVYSCPLVSDRSVRQMWLSSSHVRELRLASCGPLTDIAFPAPPRLLTSSTAALDLGTSQRNRQIRQLTGPHGSESAPTSRGASPVGHPPTQHGDESTTSITHSSMASSLLMTAPLKPLKAFEHLRVLDLTACNTISDVAVEGIISCAPRIRNLVLSKCTRLTDDSVFSIAKLRKNLQYLHLGHVSNITDRSICHLVNYCTRLRYFDLACCSQLTDLSVTEIAAKLPKLKRIGLVRVTRITDASLYALVERHLTLQRIHLSYCDNISVAAVFWLLERLPKVTHISLTGVTAFRRPELQAMCRPPPEEFSAHQRETFCVYSGQGVVDLQHYLRQLFSTEESAAQLGELTPEVQRAVQLVKQRNERDRHNRRIIYSRALAAEMMVQRRPFDMAQAQAIADTNWGTSGPVQPQRMDHPLSSVAGAMQNAQHVPRSQSRHNTDMLGQDMAAAASAYADILGRIPGAWSANQPALADQGWPPGFVGSNGLTGQGVPAQQEQSIPTQGGNQAIWGSGAMPSASRSSSDASQDPRDPHMAQAARAWYAGPSQPQTNVPSATQPSQPSTQAQSQASSSRSSSWLQSMFMAAFDDARRNPRDFVRAPDVDTGSQRLSWTRNDDPLSEEHPQPIGRPIERLDQPNAAAIQRDVFGQGRAADGSSSATLSEPVQLRRAPSPSPLLAPGARGSGTTEGARPGGFEQTQSPAASNYAGRMSNTQPNSRLDPPIVNRPQPYNDDEDDQEEEMHAYQGVDSDS